MNCLPAEILARIFEQVSEATLQPLPFPLWGYANPFYAGDYYLGLKQVCSLWRSVFLSFSTLWSRIIDFGNLHYPVQLFLERCGNCPLRIVTDHWRGLEAMATQSNQVQELTLIAPSWGTIPNYLGPFRQPAPLLEFFVFGVWSEFRYGDSSGVMEAVLPPLLFAGETPRLRKLSLVNIRTWEGNYFRGLTHLCIKGVIGDIDQSLQTFRELLDILKSNPGLEELYLSEVDAWIPIGGLGDDELAMVIGIARLRNMRRLSFGSCFSSQMSPLISRIVLPVGTLVSLPHVTLDATVHNLFGIGYSFENLCDIKSVELNLNRHLHAIVTGVGSSGSFHLKSESAPNLPLRSHFPGFILPQIVDIWLVDFELSRWRGGAPMPFSMSEWIALLDALDSVRNLYLHHFRHAEVVLNVLGKPGSESPLICRSLESLYISGETYCSPDSLLWCLQLRHEQGYPIHRLHIEELNFPDGESLPANFVGTCVGFGVEHVELNAPSPRIKLPEEVHEGVTREYWPSWEEGLYS